VVYNHDLILEMGVSLKTEKNESRYEHQTDVQNRRDVSSIQIALRPQMIRKRYNHLRPGSEVFSTHLEGKGGKGESGSGTGEGVHAGSAGEGSRLGGGGTGARSVTRSLGGGGNGSVDVGSSDNGSGGGRGSRSSRARNFRSYGAAAITDSLFTLLVDVVRILDTDNLREW
jgi:hypothetical protein